VDLLSIDMVNIYNIIKKVGGKNMIGKNSFVILINGLKNNNGK